MREVGHGGTSTVNKTIYFLNKKVFKKNSLKKTSIYYILFFLKETCLIETKYKAINKKKFNQVGKILKNIGIVEN